jgi:sugar phosphate isomerase/epimerase
VTGPEWMLGGSTWGFFVGDDSSAWIPRSEAVRAIVGAGLGVEIWPTRGLHDADPPPTEVGRMREACAEAPFVSVHIRGRYWNWSPANLREEIGFAAVVGARTLVVHPVCLGLVHRRDRLDPAEIARIAGYGAARGVRLALENVRDTIWALDRVLDAIGDDPEETNVGICIDVGHALLSSDAGDSPVRAYLERYRDQLAHLHVHDNDGVDDGHSVPGEGLLAWGALAATLCELGYAGPAVLEVQRSGDDPSRAIEEGVRFLRSLSARCEGEDP